MRGMTSRAGQGLATARCLVIVCGLPGSGTTTVARQLDQQRHGVRLGPDEWMEALGVNLWDETMRARVGALQWAVAQQRSPQEPPRCSSGAPGARDERSALREQVDSSCRAPHRGQAGSAASASYSHQQS